VGFEYNLKRYISTVFLEINRISNFESSIVRTILAPRIAIGVTNVPIFRRWVRLPESKKYIHQIEKEHG